MSSHNNNKEEISVLNTVLNTVRLVKSFSVKPEKCITITNFDKFCEREHITFSSGVIWALEEFLERHSYNPQPTLDRCLRLNMPAKPNTICFVEGCRAKSRYQLILKNYKGEKETFNVCGRHKRWRHKEFKFIVRIKEIG